MSISPARLAANRANAAKSTGPTTDAGKARSRANAVKHGLRSLVVPVADEATIHARAIGVFETFRPRTEVQAWFCGRVTQTMIQLDHLSIIERQTRDEVAHRAETSWEDDQRREANRLGARLSRSPEQTVDQLRQTGAGCDWLITRWAQLADQAGRQSWTDDQKTLAHDLLGTPPEFRAEPPTHQVDAFGQAVNPALTEWELAHAQLNTLHESRLMVSDTDEATRLLAAARLNDFGNRDLGRVRGYGLRLWKILNLSIEYARHETPPALANTPFLRSMPAHFFDPPAASPETEVEPMPAVAPDEPKLEVESTPPNEPNDEPESPVLTNEPRVEVAPIVTNEPTVELEPVATNEPKVEVKSALTNRSQRPSLGELSRAATALGPELLALIEADLPDPDTLDPDWCRQYIAANLNIDPACLGAGPPRPGPAPGRPAACG